MQANTNAEVAAKLAEVDQWRSVGVDDYELPDVMVAVVAEAKARGIKSRFESDAPLKYDTTVKFTR